MSTRAERAARFVAAKLGVSWLEMLSHRRQAALVRARSLFVWCMRVEEPRPGLNRIAQLMERDHTSIRHLEHKAAILIARDEEFFRLCADWRASELSRKEAPDACA